MSNFLPLALAVLAIFLSSCTTLPPATTPTYGNLTDSEFTNNTKYVGAISTVIINTVADLFQNFGGYFQDLLKEVTDEYPEDADVYQDLIKTLSEATYDLDGDAIEKITDDIQKLLKKSPKGLRKFFHGFLEHVLDVKNDLYKKFSPEFDKIFDAIESDPENIADSAADLLDKTKDLLRTVFKGIIVFDLETLIQISGRFMMPVKKIDDGFRANFPKIYDKFILPLLKSTFDDNSNLFKDTVSNFGDILAINRLVSGADVTGMNFLKTVFALKRIVGDLLSGIMKINLETYRAFNKPFKQILKAIIKNGADIEANFAEIIGDLMEKLLTDIFDVDSDLYKQFSGRFKQILDKIAGDTDHILKYIPEFLTTFDDLLKTVVLGVTRVKLEVLRAFAQGFQDIFNELDDQVENFGSFVSGALDSFEEFLYTFFVDYAAQLKGVSTAGFGAVVRLLKGIAELIVRGIIII